MPLSLLTPWLLGGIALVAVPWFIHRIRRPEREVARGRLALIEPTYESTDFHNAIRAALEHLRRGQAASDRRRVVHVLTDLQAAGLEEGVRGLVPLDVELRFIAVGGPRSNATVQDAIIARAGSSLIARARIKNWNIPSSDFTVRLVVDGRSIEERVVRIPPGNATLVVDYPGSSVRAAVARDAQRPDGERQRHLRAYRRRELVATRWRRMELRGSRGPPTTASGHARTRALDTR